MKRIIISERCTDPGHSGWCWNLGKGFKNRTVAIHLSVGPPVWWKPSLHRKKSGISEWGVGWLLVAIQVATKKKANS